jgi:putative addiction module killer protein
MIEVRKTDTFVKWLDRLSDIRARVRALARIDRLGDGNPGNAKSVGAGVVEMRIGYGPGYRVYYTQRGHDLGVPRMLPPFFPLLLNLRNAPFF